MPTEVPAMADAAWSGSPATPHAAREKGESPMALALAAAAAASNSQASGGRKAIECTMCFVEGIVVGFSRKSDFKKHLQNFHHTNTLWMCQYAGCAQTFDFEKAYVAHVKASHTDMHLPPSRARVEMCPQLVFACGFRGCKDRVFEARSEEEAASLRDKYFDHVAKHFDMGFCVAEWEYYTQIHNLLRQESVKDVWKQCVWQKNVRNSLRWQPRTAADLKRLLECRHVGDLPRLLHWAWTLGGEPFNSINCDAPELPPGFQRPLKKECPLSATNHDVLLNPARAQQYYQQQAQEQEQKFQAEQQQQAQQQAQQSQSQQQSFQYSISHPKPPPPQAIFVPDPRRSASSSAKPPTSAPAPATPQQQHAMGRHVLPEQETWQPHPDTPTYSMHDGATRWHSHDEDYHFGSQSSEHLATHHAPSAPTSAPQPPPTAVSEPVDHPMGGVQAAPEMHHHLPTASPTHSQHQPSPIPTQAQAQTWTTQGPPALEVMALDDGHGNVHGNVVHGHFEDPHSVATPKTPKRPLSFSQARKSLDTLRFKRREVAAPPEELPPLPGMGGVPQGFDLPMRAGTMGGTFYHEETRDI